MAGTVICHPRFLRGRILAEFSQNLTKWQNFTEFDKMAEWQNFGRIFTEFLEKITEKL